MPRVITPIVYGKGGPREGKGFSRGELEEAGISMGEALRLGIPVDKRRSTKYEENVERIRAYVEEARKAGISFQRPRIEVKPKRGRVYRGLTSAGKKMRGLRKIRGLGK
ncbi:hypothetical protein DRO56_04810 [Candidatus Bathyarchaeota archaeon]|nr:MAG: hypothetical protein CW700_05230 [Candidatus Bathyarchaeota archaeon]RLI31713.1 MAG: hypothetical protein DRO56_04810 [Candidatus Bathyarchaeota archaeon]